MVTTHEEHQCKECQEKCSTFIELLKHISKQHCKEKDEIQCKEDDISNKKSDEKEEDKDSSFIFHESVLDEFIIKKGQCNVK